MQYAYLYECNFLTIRKNDTLYAFHKTTYLSIILQLKFFYKFKAKNFVIPKLSIKKPNTKKNIHKDIVINYTVII